MKPQFIKKKTAQRIKEGYWDDLMMTIEEGFDLYNLDEFNRGYNACVDDLDVFARRLSSKIMYTDEYNEEDLTEIIKNFYNENIRTK